MQPNQQDDTPQQVQPENQAMQNQKPQKNQTQQNQVQNNHSVQPGDVYEQGSADHQRVYAGFWVRFLALIIDSFVLFIPSVFVGAIIGFTGFENELVINLLSFLIGFFYFVYMESSEQQATLGKKALSLQVINENGERLSFQKAAIRYLSKIVSGIILFIGYLMAAFDSKKQALHDKIADTYVVRV